MGLKKIKDGFYVMLTKLDEIITDKKRKVNNGCQFSE